MIFCTVSHKTSLHANEFLLIILSPPRSSSDEANILLSYDLYVPLEAQSEFLDGFTGTDYLASTLTNTNSELGVNGVLVSTLDTAIENGAYHQGHRSTSGPPSHYYSGGDSTLQTFKNTFSSDNLPNLMGTVYPPRPQFHQTMETTLLDSPDIDKLTQITLQNEPSLPWYLCSGQSPFGY